MDKHTQSQFLTADTTTIEGKEEVFTHPYEPGVHGAEHGSVRHDGFVDLVHVVHQPAELHGAEVRADRESCFMLQGDNDCVNASTRAAAR